MRRPLLTDDDLTILFLALWAPPALLAWGLAAAWRQLRRRD